MKNTTTYPFGMFGYSAEELEQKAKHFKIYHLIQLAFNLGFGMMLYRTWALRGESETTLTDVLIYTACLIGWHFHVYQEKQDFNQQKQRVQEVTNRPLFANTSFDESSLLCSPLLKTLLQLGFFSLECGFAWIIGKQLWLHQLSATQGGIFLANALLLTGLLHRFTLRRLS